NSPTRIKSARVYLRGEAEGKKYLCVYLLQPGPIPPYGVFTTGASVIGELRCQSAAGFAGASVQVGAAGKDGSQCVGVVTGSVPGGGVELIEGPGMVERKRMLIRVYLARPLWL
ncbi:hypothetical protein BaRGS_00006514, partial [Batillaria attramentaria]